MQSVIQTYVTESFQTHISVEVHILKADNTKIGKGLFLKMKSSGTYIPLVCKYTI